jgi:competence protein ComEC
MLVGLVWLVLGGGKSKRRLPVWLALTLLLLLAVYTVFTGATPSVVRAAIMSTVLLLAPILGRRYDPLAALAVSAALMLLFDPDVLADAGFQLSFLAILGITLVSPYLLTFFDSIRFRKVRFPQLVAYPLSASLGAVVLTVPVVTLLTGRLSLVSPFATLSADFVLPPLMIAGIFTVLAGVAGATAAAIPALFVWPCAWWLITNAQVWSSLPGATIEAPGVSIPHALLYYLALFLVVSFLSNRRRMHFPRLRPFLGTALLALLAIAVWTTALVMLIS